MVDYTCIVPGVSVSMEHKYLHGVREVFLISVYLFQWSLSDDIYHL